jgi:hypothetical protein
MLTETAMNIMLANLLSAAAALPFIAAQHSCASDGKPSQSSSLKRRQAIAPSRIARRRGQNRSELHTPASHPRRQTDNPKN